MANNSFRSPLPVHKYVTILLYNAEIGVGVAATEDDIIRDEQERSNLLRAIADVETAIAVSTPGTRRVLENTLDNAKKRVTTLDKNIIDAKAEHQAAQQAQLVAASLVAKETALNAREQQTYGGFLKEDFFTRRDFGKLAEFYAHTWDRLSEGGKDEMSHRIWEGVRHKEYQFSDLPDAVKEREEKQAYRRLHDSALGLRNGGRIPDEDKADFDRAYEAGDQKEAAKILDRESFRQNIFLGANAREMKHTSATVGKATDAQTVANTSASKATDQQPSQSPPTDSLSSLDLASLDLGGMRTADHPADGAVANISRTRGGNVREG